MSSISFPLSFHLVIFAGTEERRGQGPLDHIPLKTHCHSQSEICRPTKPPNISVLIIRGPGGFNYAGKPAPAEPSGPQRLVRAVRRLACLPLIYPLFTLYVSLIYPLFTPYLPLIYPLFTCYLPLVYPLFTTYLPLIYPLFTPYLPVMYPLFTPYSPLIYPLIFALFTPS